MLPLKRFIIAIVLTALIIPLAAYVFLTVAVLREGQISNDVSFFQNVVRRAIQLETHGQIAAPADRFYNGFDHDAPKEVWTEAYAFFKPYLSRSQPIPCFPDLEIPFLDPMKFRRVVMGFSRSHRPLEFYVVFHGPPPDLSPFFEPETRDALLGPVPLFYDILPDRTYNPNRYTLMFDFETAVLRREEAWRPKKITWTAQECRGYSVFLFEEEIAYSSGRSKI